MDEKEAKEKLTVHAGGCVYVKLSVDSIAVESFGTLTYRGNEKWSAGSISFETRNVWMINTVLGTPHIHLKLVDNLVR